MNFLLSTIVYSQNLALNKNNDTIFCFSKEQAKFLYTQYLNFQKCDELYSVCQQDVIFRDSIIGKKDDIIKVEKQIIENQKEIITLKTQENDNLTIINLGLNGEIKKQKRYKWFAIVGGSLLVAISSFK